MAKAEWNGVILAESDSFETVEGNIYFPPESINQEFFITSDTGTFCPWKGMASYYSIQVNGETNADAAWTYREPYAAASRIKDHIAFWKGVVVSE